MKKHFSSAELIFILAALNSIFTKQMTKISKKVSIILSGILVGGITTVMIITEGDSRLKKRLDNLKNQVKKNKIFKQESSIAENGIEDWFI